MNKKSIFRMAVVAALILSCLVSLSVSASGSGYDLYQELIQLPDFKFTRYDYGIGYGNCPVYTAPFSDAYRCNNGKASCDTNSKMYVQGFYAGWLMIRYDTNNGGTRVGYIPPSYVRGFSFHSRQFEHFIPATADATIMVTDNPMMPGTRFAELYAGTPFYVLAKYTYHGDWWYIECTVDGQTARGFIDRSSSNFSVGGYPVTGSNQSYGYQDSSSHGKPSLSPLGTSCMGEVRIDGDAAGNRVIVREDANPNSKQITVAYPGKRYPCYAEKRGSTGKIWYYIWVDSDSAWGWVSSGHATLLQ